MECHVKSHFFTSIQDILDQYNRRPERKTIFLYVQGSHSVGYSQEKEKNLRKICLSFISEKNFFMEISPSASFAYLFPEKESGPRQHNFRTNDVRKNLISLPCCLIAETFEFYPLFSKRNLKACRIRLFDFQGCRRTRFILGFLCSPLVTARIHFLPFFGHTTNTSGPLGSNCDGLFVERNLSASTFRRAIFTNQKHSKDSFCRNEIKAFLRSDRVDSNQLSSPSSDASSGRMTSYVVDCTRLWNSEFHLIKSSCAWEEKVWGSTRYQIYP